MHNRYKDKVQFLAVYVREAHPSDGWASPGNDKVGITFLQPKTLQERIGVAQKCCTALEMNMPLLVDDVNDRVGHAYSGMPDRLYIIDRDGKVAYQGGRGPFEFKPGEMEQVLAMLLLDQEANDPAVQQGRLPVLPNGEAWKRLPKAIDATSAAALPLPAWARMLAGVMPTTTARMLELDAMHRTGKRLDPKLRGMMRWAAADENQCATARAYAELDLRRAGMSESAIAAFIAGNQRARNASEGFTLTQPERAALTFARKMMRAAHSITDEEVKYLDEQFGAKQVVAMVALMAHASFQDRMLLALAAPVEEGGPLPPLTVTFPKQKRAKEKKAQASPGPVVAPRPGATARPNEADPDWLALGIMDLRKKVDVQRAKPLRIRVPTDDEMRRALPANHRMAKGTKIVWSQICYGYQPELTDAWFDSVEAFRSEAKLDRVLQTSMFWVVTRALQCFY